MDFKSLMLKLQDAISVFGDKYSVVFDVESSAVRVKTSTGCITSTLVDSILAVSSKIEFNSVSVSRVDGNLMALFFVYE